MSFNLRNRLPAAILFVFMLQLTLVPRAFGDDPNAIPPSSPTSLSYEGISEENSKLIQFNPATIKNAKNGSAEIQISGHAPAETIVITNRTRILVPESGEFSISQPLGDSETQVPIYVVQKSGDVVRIQLRIEDREGETKTTSATTSRPEKGSEKAMLPKKVTAAPVIKPFEDDEPKATPEERAEFEQQFAESDRAEKKKTISCPASKITPFAKQSGDRPLDYTPAENNVAISPFFVKVRTSEDRAKWLVVGGLKLSTDTLTPSIAGSKAGNVLSLRLPSAGSLPKDLAFWAKEKSHTIPFKIRNKKGLTDLLLDISDIPENQEGRICGETDLTGESNASGIYFRFCSAHFSIRDGKLKVQLPAANEAGRHFQIVKDKTAVDLKQEKIEFKDKIALQVFFPNGALYELRSSTPVVQYLDVIMQRKNNTLFLHGKDAAPIGSSPDELGWSLRLPFRDLHLQYPMATGLIANQDLIFKACPPDESYRVFVDHHSPLATYSDDAHLRVRKPKNADVTGDGAAYKDGNWDFEVGDRGADTFRKLKEQVGPEKYSVKTALYHAYATSLGADLILTFDTKGPHALEGGANAAHWFETAFGASNRYLSYQRWGITAAYDQRFVSFGTDSIHSEKDYNVGLNYRLSPGIQNHDPSFILNVRFHDQTLDPDNIGMIEGGLIWSSEPIGVFKWILDFVPFLHSPRWLELGIYGGLVPIVSSQYDSVQTFSFTAETKYFLKPNLALKFGGSLEWLTYDTASYTLGRIQSTFKL